MEISNNLNNYQTLQTQQRPITLPEKPEAPKYTNGEIYEASQGNAIRNNEGEIVLTPQGQNNLDTQKSESAAEAAATAQAQKDEQRATATGFLAHQSKKSQVEIYLAVATDSKISSDDSTATIVESLRDVQKQNNAVAAYATYQENQELTKPALF